MKANQACQGLTMLNSHTFAKIIWKTEVLYIGLKFWGPMFLLEMLHCTLEFAQKQGMILMK